MSHVTPETQAELYSFTSPAPPAECDGVFISKIQKLMEGGGEGKGDGGLKGRENKDGGYREGYSPLKPLTIKHLRLKKGIGRSVKEA